MRGQHRTLFKMNNSVASTLMSCPYLEIREQAGLADVGKVFISILTASRDTSPGDSHPSTEELDNEVTGKQSIRSVDARFQCPPDEIKAKE